MKEKIKNFLLGINFELIALLCYLVKLIVAGADYPDALIVASLAGLCGYRRLLKLKEPKDINSSTRQEIQELKNAVSTLNLGQNLNKKKKYF